eukprot:COSAG06_NODE_3591_length_5143_cov_3.495440_5_plen_155_part_00
MLRLHCCETRFFVHFPAANDAGGGGGGGAGGPGGGGGGGGGRGAVASGPKGYVDTQSAYLCQDGEPPVNVHVSNSTNVTFVGCSFQHLGGVYAIGAQNAIFWRHFLLLKTEDFAKTGSGQTQNGKQKAFLQARTTLRRALSFQTAPSPTAPAAL